MELPIFSKRCSKIIEDANHTKDILTPIARNRIQKTCEAFDKPIAMARFGYLTVLNNQLWETIQIEHGWEGYATTGFVPRFRGIPDIFSRGPYYYVFDMLELYVQRHIMKDKQESFTDTINQILLENRIQYRFADNCIIKMDSEYFEQEVLAVAVNLLESHDFEKAINHFSSARYAYTIEDWSNCAVECSNALESVIKHILGKNIEKQNEQLKLLRTAGIIPNYFDGFWDRFITFPQTIFTIRAKSGGHGDAPSIESASIADNALASFAINLTGTILLFLMEKYTHYKTMTTSID